MNRFTVLKNGFTYLNGSGEDIAARAGGTITVQRLSDVRVGLKGEYIEPADGLTRAAHTMTSANVEIKDGVAAPIIFEIGDLVTFTHNKKEAMGEVKSIAPKGILAVDIGVEDAEDIVRIDPRKVDVERVS